MYIKPTTVRKSRCYRSPTVVSLTGGMALLASVVLSAIEPSKSYEEPRRTEHWAFQPITRPAPRAVSNANWPQNAIDRFVLAKLDKEGLSPSPPADRVTLVRRLFFDVTGLPPSPEDVARFASDTSADAYEKLVDRLLASPHFGERWARHWLDVVRFSETHGFEMNNPRPNAWPYRDYVIQAFNDDKPYNDFILEQIAGNALGADEATGFLVAGPWDQVKSPDEVLTKNQRADELHDIISTVGTAFLGVTVGCARCHDHKFDPIPQRDYYAIKAVLEGVQHGERPRLDPEHDRRLAEAEERKRRIAEIETELIDFEPVAQVGSEIDTNKRRAPVNARLNVERFRPIKAQRLRFTINATTAAEPCIDELEVFGRAGLSDADSKADAVTSSPSTVRIQVAEAVKLSKTPLTRPEATLSPSDGERAGVRGANPRDANELANGGSSQNPAAGKTALRNLALSNLGTKTRASGTYPNSDLHRLEHINDGKYGNSRSWISDEPGKGWIELEFPEPVTIHRIAWGRDRDEKFKDRLATEYRIEVALETNEWKLVASSADRRAYKADQKFERDYATNGLSASVLAGLQALLTELREQQAKVKELSAVPKVYAGEFKQPEPTRRFHRGDPMQPREIIEPGILSLIATDIGCAPLSTNTLELDRRLALAHWIASTNNPLTARVVVNRLWQYHFGEGLVSTPSDFGRNGARPTHPELLDWLAAELMNPQEDVAELMGSTVERNASHTFQGLNTSTLQPWSLKHLHRLILTSATYCQSSGATADGIGVDSGTRLLWRFPPRRLEAEPLRDAMLAVAGKLDLRMGGPGWSPFEPNENYVRVYAPKKEFGSDDFRRMVYATGVRQRPDGVFGVFDCPDGGQIAPKRTRSTTPLQALNLLNSGFIMQVAGFFAERLEREAGSEPQAQVHRAFALAFCREPGSSELESSSNLIRRQGLKVFCRALFNANEFAYVF